MAKQRSKPLPSTKELPGKRVNGVLYLKKGEGNGQFHNIHGSGQSPEEYTGSSQLLPHVTKEKDDGDE